MRRPLSVSIVGWLLLLGGLLSMGIAIFLAGLDTATAARLTADGLHIVPVGAFFVIDGTARIISGYGILRGYSGARVFYLGWGLVAIALLTVVAGFGSFTIRYLFYYGLFAGLLCRRPANLWFETALV